MIKKITIVASISILLLAAACKTSAIKMNAEKKEITPEKKTVVYQVFTRLFGNKNTTNKPWGTIEENGVGKSLIIILQMVMFLQSKDLMDPLPTNKIDDSTYSNFD